MKAGTHIVFGAAARLFGPLVLLFALSLFATRAPGGVGFVAGLVFASAIALHAMVYGVPASRIALPPSLARICWAAGAIATMVGAGAADWGIAPQLMEGGLFMATAGGGALIATALFGRAAALSDAEW